MTRTLFGLLVLLGLVACGGDDDDDDDNGHPTPGEHDDTGATTDDTGGGDDDSGQPSVFKPMAGHWVITGGELVSDSCNVDPDDLPASDGDGFDLTNHGEGAFGFTLDGSPDEILCALDDHDYTCDPLSSVEDMDDWDITIHSTLMVSGDFSDRDHTTSRYDLGIDCSGSDCELAEYYYDMEFPCQVLFNAQAQAQ